ncbi:MAG: tellurium resistance protein TerC [Flavobacteriales bacterium]|nr:tellurium resistance protein TerC [Flavobacteriales bacterium]
MGELFTLNNLIDIVVLILLETVLGFDNLLYISIESQKAPEEKQSFVRKLGISIAIVLRIGLVFLLISLIENVNKSLFDFEFGQWLSGHFNVHSIIVFFGGIFIIYTAIKEIWHMLAPNAETENEKAGGGRKSVGNVLMWILLMNVVFSFDSTLSALALTKNKWVISIAVVVSSLLMVWLTDRITIFLKKNRMYEVLGLFILFVVGIMLLTEGGHLAHIKIAGNEITPMSKTTFYFVIVILVLIDVVQSKYQKNLSKKAESNH